MSERGQKVATVYTILSLRVFQHLPEAAVGMHRRERKSLKTTQQLLFLACQPEPMTPVLLTTTDLKIDQCSPPIRTPDTG